ncbi:MAG: SDR family oxidoreductase [Anaerolineales bacterium]|nr:SDR family oxidoreductase [Anaerolineales bacterium]
MSEQMNTERVVLITGASSGIGEAVAAHLAASGYLVFGTSRQAAFPTEIHTGVVNMIPMDVNNDQSVSDGVAFIQQHAERIDVLINNAGYGLAGAIEETSIEEASLQMDTNFFGAVRLTNAILPVMRKRKDGVIIYIGSVAGRIPIPFQGFYSASKFALEGYSEVLRIEVSSFNIKVYILEPGDFATGFTRSRVVSKAARKSRVYQPAMGDAISVMEHDEENGADPAQIGAAVEKLIKSRPARFRIPIGPLYGKAALVLQRILPDAWMEFAVRKYYKAG